MVNIKSNEKSRLQDDKRHYQNKSLKSQIKTTMKEAKVDKTRSAANEAVKLINSAVARGIFQENKGARLVSKIQKLGVLDVNMKQPKGTVFEEEIIVEVIKKPTPAKKPAAAKSTTAAKKPVAKSTTAAKKPTVAKSTTAAKKPVATKSTTAAKKPAAKKPAAAKSTTAAKKPAATKSTTAAKKPAVKKEETKTSGE